MRDGSPSHTIAAFVSPHGFGHAARASAVLAEARSRSAVGLELFTTAPRWLFEASLPGGFRYHEVEIDVGFRQRSALEQDTEGTVRALRRLLPFEPARVDALARRVKDSGASAVLCDIAPLGIAVAEEAGLPSVLVENFSWSWLYEPFVSVEPELGSFGEELDRWVRKATVHVQARPVCERRHELELVDPISREPRRDRTAVRAALGIEADRRLVVVTMGGYGEAMPFLDRLEALSDTAFLVTGSRRTGRDGNLLLFDNRTPLFMPDILTAADAVVAKLGYGMVSEVWRAGVPGAWVSRADSREMASLEAFASQELEGFTLMPDRFAAGEWIERLPELLSRPGRPREGGGAARVAEILLEVAGAGVSAP